jgi:NAD dependent epimerase/dehydratase
MNEKDKTVLVTGAGGFIASHLVEALLHAGYAVRALVHYNSRGSWGHLDSLNAELRARLDVRLGDVSDPYQMQTIVAGCDTVYHLAALIGIPYSYQAPASYVATNVNGTLNILEAARSVGVRRVIVTSTSEVYGTARYAPIDEEHPLQAQSPYAASKIAAEMLAESFYRSFGLPVVVLRPFNTYGPRQSARAVIPTVLSQALSGAPEIVLGNLEPRRDLTFVEDTARAFVLAGQAQGIEGQVIHFGQGSAISVRELAERCLAAAGSRARIVSSSERERPQGSEVELLLCNPAKARSLLGWTPQVPLDEGLRRVTDYMRQNLQLFRPERYGV